MPMRTASAYRVMTSGRRRLGIEKSADQENGSRVLQLPLCRYAALTSTRQFPAPVGDVPLARFANHDHCRRATMSDLIKRVTIIRQSGDKREAVNATPKLRDDDDDREERMDAPVRRVTVVQRKGDRSESSTVYEKSARKGGRKVSRWTRPFERAARRMAEAQLIYAQEVLRRHEEANQSERDGWLRDAPSIIMESSRTAYNKAGRKAVPFKILPKAPKAK
jgi:Family of unknown function (DUF6312)